MSDIPTAEEFLKGCPPEKREMQARMCEFAKLHVEAALKSAYSNTGFVETTSEKLNSEEYKPFITDENGKLWTISDKDSIINAYPLNLII